MAELKADLNLKIHPEMTEESKNLLRQIIRDDVSAYAELVAQLKTWKEECMTESNLVDIVANLVKEVKVLQNKIDAHNEDRVRQIVQEELAMWEKRQVQRARFGEQLERK